MEQVGPESDLSVGIVKCILKIGTSHWPNAYICFHRMGK